MATKNVKLAVHGRGKRKPRIKDQHHIKLGVPGVGSFEVVGTREFVNRAKPQWSALIRTLLQEFKRKFPARAVKTGRKIMELGDIGLARMKAGATRVSLSEKDLKRRK